LGTAHFEDSESVKSHDCHSLLLNESVHQKAAVVPEVPAAAGVHDETPRLGAARSGEECWRPQLRAGLVDPEAAGEHHAVE